MPVFGGNSLAGNPCQRWLEVFTDIGRGIGQAPAGI